MSNEIIERCCNTVQLQDVFDGKVDIVMPLLKQSIASGESWKEIYHKTARSIAKYGGVLVAPAAGLAMPLTGPADGNGPAADFGCGECWLRRMLAAADVGCGGLALTLD